VKARLTALRRTAILLAFGNDSTTSRPGRWPPAGAAVGRDRLDPAADRC
jgi:hypothetical protein